MTMKVMLNMYDTMYIRECEALLALKGRAGAPRPLGYGLEYPMVLHEYLPAQNLLNLVLDEDTPICTFVQALVGVVRRLRELNAFNYVHNILATGHVAVTLGADYDVQNVNLIEFTAACRRPLPRAGHRPRGVLALRARGRRGRGQHARLRHLLLRRPHQRHQQAEG
ncbi:uncharacterized protein LOC134774593 [Penaeus indicus]|uniref:uncharacterized protein LOC134774593 n=1 Tax=Penaeus indicus TaxID=29960 RepID=UPI00300D586A